MQQTASPAFSIRRLVEGDWAAYKNLRLEEAANRQAHPNRYKHPPFDGPAVDLAAKPDIYWQNVLNGFTRFGAFDPETVLLGVLGIVVLPDAKGVHTAFFFGTGLARASAGREKEVRLALDKSFLDRPDLYRRLYENLNHVRDYAGSFQEMLAWLGVTVDFGRPIDGASPYVLKSGE